MGLFWSMNPVPGVSLKPILRQADVTTPLVFRLSVMDDHIPFADLQLPSSVVLATGELQRWYKHETVRRISVRVGSLRGTLFLPEGKGPFPGVLDMFGCTGGLVEFRAALLASRGFASFALAYFKYDDLPFSLAGVDFDYFLEAVDWLASHPYVQPGGIGVVGVAKGGELAFLLGMSTNQVKVLVNISGPPFHSFSDVKKSGQIYWKGVRMDATKLKHTDEGVYLKDAACYDNEVIPAWKNNAQILYLLGDDDGTWKTDHANIFMKTCPKEKRKTIEFVTYPGAGHLIEPPYMPLYRTLYHPVLGMTIVTGGHPEAHAAAQEDAWRRLLHFLQKHIA
ncbi:acyl-coenzyme A thioesterase 2, mitochondrial-like [Haliotis rufescens]|uniref:acyl-coenzyme A thioesterase 2, mitochondrial-like n=1 Tax=Haliotis rufescens TaxID=6454 RepID=UPI00201EE7D6|nr:acyl-coenzyme A thioesterase 2, mitochondrial-like [Haliotis rufescens]